MLCVKILVFCNLSVFEKNTKTSFIIWNVTFIFPTFAPKFKNL